MVSAPHAPEDPDHADEAIRLRTPITNKNEPDSTGADQAAGLVQNRDPVLDRAAQIADAQATSTQSANTIVE